MKSSKLKVGDISRLIHRTGKGGTRKALSNTFFQVSRVEYCDVLNAYVYSLVETPKRRLSVHLDRVNEEDILHISTPVKSWNRRQVTLITDSICGTVDVNHHPKCKVVQLTQSKNSQLPYVLATIPEDYPITRHKEIIIRRKLNEKQQTQ